MQKKAQRKPVLAKPEPSKVFTIHPKQDDDDIEDIPIDNEKKQKKDPPKKVQRENASRAGKSRASENDGNNEQAHIVFRIVKRTKIAFWFEKFHLK